MKVKAIFNKMLWVILTVFFALSFCISSVVTPVQAAQEQQIQDYRETSILQDLSDVPIALYPQNPVGQPLVIRAQEYCYSEAAFFAEYYALIIYIYNPTQRELNVEERNYINMATKYDANGNPTAYSTVDLKYLDKTGNNRFYKFEVGKSSDLLAMATAYANAHNGQRRYDFVDVNLVSQDGQTIKSVGVSRTYYFRGFAKGCGTAAESTLRAFSEGLETISLNLNHTNYRTMVFNDDDICDELNTAYFSIPENYFNQYGVLQKIKAEWYEYKTDYIFVTSDEDGYDYMKDYIGQDVSDNDAFKWNVAWDNYFLSNQFGSYEHFNNYYGYKGDIPSNATSYGRMDWLFLLENVKSRDDYKVSSQEIKSYMVDYTAKYGGNKYNGYSAELFSDSVDEGRTRGYNLVEITADDRENLALPDESQSAWNKFWRGTKFKDESIDSIITFTTADLATIQAMDYKSFGEKYYINETDAATVRTYCINELKAGRRPTLFRFAKTDYYAETASFYRDSIAITKKDGYVAQETMFFDFKIISLTFCDELGAETVIGVCSSPLDIINGVEPQPEYDFGGLFRDIGKIIMVLFIAVAIALLIAFVPPIGMVFSAIFKVVWWLFSMLFKIIWWIIAFPFNIIGKLFKRRKKRKEE